MQGQERDSMVLVGPFQLRTARAPAGQVGSRRGQGVSQGPGPGPVGRPGVSLSLARWSGLAESQRGSATRWPGKPHAPCMWAVGQSPWLLGPLMLANGLPAAVPPWLCWLSPGA